LTRARRGGGAAKLPAEARGEAPSEAANSIWWRCRELNPGPKSQVLNFYNLSPFVFVPCWIKTDKSPARQADKFSSRSIQLPMKRAYPKI